MNVNNCVIGHRLVLEKGDFLALIQRQNEGDFLLANKLKSKWRKNRSKRSTKYKLLDFKLQIGQVGCCLRSRPIYLNVVRTCVSNA